MKLPLFCCALFALTGAASGQDSAGTLPPLPTGQLLKRAPDLSTWTVTSQNGAAPRQGQGQSAGAGAANLPRPQGFRQAVVTKTGRIIDEQLVDGMGRKFEIWHDNGVKMTLDPSVSTPVIGPDVSARDIYTANFAVSDFAGLDWVSPQTYAGIQKVMGRDCILFRGKVSPLPADVQAETSLQANRTALLASRNAYYAAMGATSQSSSSTGGTQNGSPSDDVSALACIDLETRLPVAVTFGQETRTYVFGQPPTSPLQLPAACATAFSAYQRHITSLSRTAAAP